MKKILISNGIIIIILCGTFAGLWYGCRRPAELIVNIKIPQINKITKIVKTCPEWKSCYDSQINIMTETIGSLLMIRAADNCKQSELGLDVVAAAMKRKHMIMPQILLSVGYNSDAKKVDIMPGFMLNYSRMFGRAGIGAGIGYSRGTLIRQDYLHFNINGSMQF